jgi:hypothetical protein
MSEFGNTSWVVFVTAAYTVSALALLGFALFAWGVRRKSLRSLKEEGYLSDDMS